MMKNERQQSDVNIEVRISFRLDISGASWSDGIPLNARCSADDTKESKNKVGAIANKRAIPPVKAKLT